MSTVETSVEDARQALDAQIGGPKPLVLPAGWTLTESWQRAQVDDAVVAPHGPARFSVILGDGDRHRNTFAIKGGDLVTQCNCHGYKFRDFCAHVAHLWWRWARARLATTDLDTGRTHLSPPPWLSVERRQK